MHPTSLRTKKVVCDAGRFPAAKWSHRTVFFKSLICNVSPSLELLHLCADPNDGMGTARIGQLHQRAPLIDGLNSNARPGPSPYPEIDGFITSVCNEASAIAHLSTALLGLGMKDHATAHSFISQCCYDQPFW
jgi:hypothetical protein